MPSLLDQLYFWLCRISCGLSRHIHIDCGNLSAKFWLEPVALARNVGYAAHQLRELRKLIESHHTELLEAWYGHFGAKRG